MATTPSILQTLGPWNGSNVYNSSGTFGSSTTSGSTIVLVSGWHPTNSAYPATISDNQGNSSWQLAKSMGSPGERCVYVHYHLNITGGSSHEVTINFGGVTGYATFFMYEMDAYAGAVDTTGEYQNGAAGDLFFAASGQIDTVSNVAIFQVSAGGSNYNGSRVTAGSPYTKDGEAAYGYFGHYLSSSARTDDRGTATVQAISSSRGISVSFKNAGGGPTGRIWKRAGYGGGLAGQRKGLVG